MILILGKGIVGNAAIEYFNQCHQEIFIYEDNVVSNERDIDKFQLWEQIDLVVISPGFSSNHHMIKSAIEKNIKITNDIGIFLENWPGIKIGITGTNGKSTLCAMLNHILNAQKANSAFVGGNFGISPLKSAKTFDYYIIEVSSYQLETLAPKALNKFDIGIITNIEPHHIDRHGNFENYINEKKKMLHAKNQILGSDDAFETWPFAKAIMPDELPDSNLFKQKEYKDHWAIISSIIKTLNLNEADALAAAATFAPLKYRQEIIAQAPIKVINDSKATSPAAAICALKNMEHDFCWLAGGAKQETWHEQQILKLENLKHKIKKAYLINNNIELIDILKSLNIQFEVMEGGADKFKHFVKHVYQFCLNNKLDLLFSPGYQSFDKFKNYEERGKLFSEYINEID